MSDNTHQKKDEWLEELHRCHYAQVLRLARYLLEPYYLAALAEDIAQDVFVEALRQADDLIDHRNTAGWLMKTARYKCNNALRAGMREARRTAFSIDHPDAPEVEDSRAQAELAEAIEAQQDLDAVMRSLQSQMTDQEYQLYLSVYRHKQPLTQLAGEYGISNSALRTRICRVRQKMLRLLRIILSLLVTFYI